MKKLDKLEKYIKVPDTKFYGVYFYDGEDLKMYLTLVENPAHVEDGVTKAVAAGVSRYSTDYYWQSYSAGTGDNRELIYSYLHPNG